jgi:Ser/Thr protein kinase RdoA (MazF antagonist)
MRTMLDAKNITLSPEALRAEVVSHYDLPSPVECSLLVSGAHDTFLIETGGDRYVLKVYRVSLRTQPEVLDEIDALLHLGGKGVSVALPVARRDGAYAWNIATPSGERPAVLFTYAKGQSPSSRDETSCYRLGRALAVIHQASDDFASPRVRYDLAQLLDRPLRLHEPLLQQRPEEWRYLQDLARRLRERISTPSSPSAPVPAAALDWGFCHGEFNARNNHLDEATGTVTSFDFEGCGTGFRAYDLAVFRYLVGLGEGDEDPEPLWQAYLRGYSERRPLRAIDREAIPLFVPMRPLWILGNIIVTHKPRPEGGVPNPAFFDEMLEFLRAWEQAYL